MPKWEDITDVLNAKGKRNLKIGQVLMFDNEGIPIHLKIMRKYKGKVWAKHTHLYTGAELNRKAKKLNDAIRPEET
jgi:hypothetical protein